jgi:hypothetical protein
MSLSVVLLHRLTASDFHISRRWVSNCILSASNDFLTSIHSGSNHICRRCAREGLPLKPRPFSRWKTSKRSGCSNAKKATTPSRYARSCQHASADGVHPTRQLQLDQGVEGRRKRRATIISGRLPDSHIDALIAIAREKAPFHSVLPFASVITYPHTTLWRQLHTTGCIVCTLHLVSHGCPPVQKRERVDEAKELRKVLHSAKHRIGAIS